MAINPAVAKALNKTTVGKQVVAAEKKTSSSPAQMVDATARDIADKTPIRIVSNNPPPDQEVMGPVAPRPGETKEEYTARITPQNSNNNTSTKSTFVSPIANQKKGFYGEYVNPGPVGTNSSVSPTPGVTPGQSNQTTVSPVKPNQQTVSPIKPKYGSGPGVGSKTIELVDANTYLERKQDEIDTSRQNVNTALRNILRYPVKDRGKILMATSQINRGQQSLNDFKQQTPYPQYTTLAVEKVNNQDVGVSVYDFNYTRWAKETEEKQRITLAEQYRKMDPASRFLRQSSITVLSGFRPETWFGIATSGGDTKRAISNVAVSTFNWEASLPKDNFQKFVAVQIPAYENIILPVLTGGAFKYISVGSKLAKAGTFAGSAYKYFVKPAQIGIAGVTSVVMGVDIGYTGATNPSALGPKLLGISAQLIGIGVGYKAAWEIPELHPFKTKLLYGKNPGDFGGFDRSLPGRKITEISTKGITESNIKTTAIDEPYSSEFLQKQYTENPSIKTRGFTEQEYVKTYAGRTPRELLLNARELQGNVRRRATWIQDKAILKGDALKVLSLDGKIKTGFKGIDPFERMPDIATETNIGGEFLKTEAPKTTMKISKPFEFVGENKMPTSPKDIDLLMSKVGKTSKSLLGLPEGTETAQIKNTSSGFSNMDELGGFKKMYGRRTVMLLEEEQPVSSRMWERQFMGKPERPSMKTSFGGYDIKPLTAFTVGSMIGQGTRETQTDLQKSIQNTIQNLDQSQRQISISLDLTGQKNKQTDINLNLNIQRVGQAQLTIQEQKQQQIQLQEQLQKTIQVTMQTPRTPETTIPRYPWFPDLPSGIKTDRKQETSSYNVYVKDRSYVHGKKRYAESWKKANTTPLSEEAALSLGGTAVDQSAAASFKIRPTDGQAKQLKIGVDPWGVLSGKFYKSKGTYIESTSNRIDSSGEIKGISALGWIANQRRTTYSPVSTRIDYKAQGSKTIQGTYDIPDFSKIMRGMGL